MKITAVCKTAKDKYGTCIDQEYWGCLMITVTTANEQLLWLLKANELSFVGLR